MTNIAARIGLPVRPRVSARKRGPFCVERLDSRFRGNYRMISRAKWKLDSAPHPEEPTAGQRLKGCMTRTRRCATLLTMRFLGIPRIAHPLVSSFTSPYARHCRALTRRSMWLFRVCGRSVRTCYTSRDRTYLLDCNLAAVLFAARSGQTSEPSLEPMTVHQLRPRSDQWRNERIIQLASAGSLK